MHQLRRFLVKLPPASQVVDRHKKHNKAAGQQDHKLDDIRLHHRTEPPEIGINSREKPQNKNEHPDADNPVGVQNAQVFGKHQIRRVGAPKQRSPQGDGGKEGNIGNGVEEAYRFAKALFDKLGDRQHAFAQIEGHKNECCHEYALNSIDFQAGLRQTVEIGRTHHAQELIAIDIGCDSRQGNGGPAQITVAEKIGFHTYFLTAAPRKSRHKNEQEVPQYDEQIQHDDDVSFL